MKPADILREVRALPARLESMDQLDRVTEPASRTIDTAIERTGWRELLSGKKLLGHALHPALTDLPIGFWTSAFVLDFLGGKKSKRAATLMVFSGIATAVPTAMTGAHDFTELDQQKKRVGIIHAVSNSVALLFYVGSFLARIRGRRGRGVYLGVLGAAAATLGGYLGGELVFGENNADEPDASTSTIDVREANAAPLVTSITG